MGKYQAYPEYKDSGVDGLGMMPVHWISKKLKWELSIKSGSDDKTEGGVYQLHGANGIIGYSNTASIGENEYRVLIGRVGSAGEVNYVKGSAAVSDNALIVRNNIIKSSKFDYYLLSSLNLKNLVSKNAQPLITASHINDVLVAVPTTLDERKKIAAFLDHETAKIDALIEKQQQLIQLLKEKRQAVISHAVTKGLNPNAPMKDSGIEWLGEVPAHWEVVPIKHACILIKDGTHLPPPRVDNGIPLLSVRNIIDGQFLLKDDDSNISEKDYQALCKSFIPEVNDVVLAIVGATLGKVAVVNISKPFHVQRSVAIFRTSRQTLSPFMLKNIFDSKGFQSLLWEHVGFSAQPGIYLGVLANFQIPIPPIAEQLQILSYLNDKLDRLQELAMQAEIAVKILQERRTALISAAVTGKIDVRNFADPVPR